MTTVAEPTVAPPVPMLDVNRQNGPLMAEFERAIAEIGRSGRVRAWAGVQGSSKRRWPSIAASSMRSAAPREAMRCCWR